MRSPWYYIGLLFLAPLLLPAFILFLIGMFSGMFIDSVVNKLDSIDCYINTNYEKLFHKVTKRNQ